VWRRIPERSYARAVENLAPKLIDKPVVVKFINDEDCSIQGCFQKVENGKRKRNVKREFGVLVVNLAYHNLSPEENYILMLHELAHNTLYSNDHLAKVFYDTVTELGAKLAIIALAEPKLFDIEAHSCHFPGVQPLGDAAHDVYPEPYGEGVAACTCGENVDGS
jgi:hypothetical protein